MQEKVGDPENGFRGKLDAMVAQGHMGEYEKGQFLIIVDAGHAAAHRSYTPNEEDIDKILTAVEALLYRLYVLPGDAMSVEAGTPKRLLSRHRSVDDLAKALSRARGSRLVPLHSTRWCWQAAPENSGATLDACYYFESGSEFPMFSRFPARIDQPKAMAAFEQKTPPDLVVEVERSRGEDGTPGFYRDAGVAKMWRLTAT